MPEQKTHPRLIKIAAVVDRTTLSSSEIYERIAEGSFPRPTPIGPRRVAWLESTIDQWIADRVAEAETAHAEDGR